MSGSAMGRWGQPDRREISKRYVRVGHLVCHSLDYGLGTDQRQLGPRSNRQGLTSGTWIRALKPVLHRGCRSHWAGCRGRDRAEGSARLASISNGFPLTIGV